MKFLLALTVALVAVSSAVALRPLADAEYEFLYTKWLNQHQKQYATTEETFYRYTVWKKNLDYIRKVNHDSTKSHKLAMNQHGDLTNEEFRQRYNGYNNIDISFLRAKNFVDLSDVVVPASVDWAKAGKVTPVKDQGQCGSCWAFSTTGSVEAAYAIAANLSTPVSLSEQELVDCSQAQGNQGCNGGLMDQAFQFIISNKGLCGESDYPYKATDGTCQASCTSKVTVSGYSDVPTKDEDALKAAVAQQPVSVAVDAGGLDWQFYSSGVMSDACGTELDHGVLAAGYGTLDGKDYWLVKNSWGSGWGQQGYVLLKRASGSGQPGECGITLAASFPTGATQA